MLITLLGIMVFLHPVTNVLDDVSMIALQLSRESYLVFPLSTTMEVKLEQSWNAFPSIDITLLGMSIEIRPLQP